MQGLLKTAVFLIGNETPLFALHADYFDIVFLRQMVGDTGIGDGIVAKNANEAVGKFPKNMGLLTRTMIIGQAITETTDIYSLVVALILIFVV